MAITNTRITDLVPSEKALSQAVDLLLPARNVLLNSGLAVRTSDVDAVAGGGPRKSSIQYINPLSTDEVNVSTDLITDEGNTGNITADEYTVLRHDLNYGWGFADLTQMVTKYDSEGGVRAGIAQYWATIYAKLISASLNGVKASISALPTTGGTTAQNAKNAATKAAILFSSTSDFAMSAIYDAAAAANDYADLFDTLMVGPGRYAKMQADEENNFVPKSKTGTSFAEYQGFKLIRTTTLGLNDAVLCRQGSVAFGEGTPPGLVPIELERRANGANGGGAGLLHSRRSFVIHPQGMNYNGSIPGKTTDLVANLSNAASWSLEVPHEMLGFRFLTFNAS